MVVLATVPGILRYNLMAYDHWLQVRKVCVIGAGTMGSGIAAHLANLGFEVTLLDLTTESVNAAFEKAKNARPPHFYVPETADRIRLGSIQENIGWAAEADWVVEVIIEKIEAKKMLFAQLDTLLPATTAVTTNTSGLQISLLAEGLSEGFRQRFMGTHFFNPPRYLKLLELIPTADTDPEAVQSMTRFLEQKVARRVVLAKDTPGFIANRFGMWAMFHAIHTTEKLGMTVEQVDAVTGPFLGRPRSASFRLNDLVGLDIMQDIATNLWNRCPEDPFRDTLQTPKSMQVLAERGWIGEKAGQGYYRREGKELVVFDLMTNAYRQRQDVVFSELDAIAKERLGNRVALALDMRNEPGELLRNHLVPVLQYANYLKESISHSVLDFDRVMKWGFGWEMGPFDMIDAIGPAKLGIDGPFYQGDEVKSFSGGWVPRPSEPEYRQVTDYPVIAEYKTFRTRDLGDGIVAVALTTKMGTITPELITELTPVIASLDRFVLASEARHFSLGFDLKFFNERIEQQDWAGIDQALAQLQNFAVSLSTKRVVAALHGYTLGAGLEVAFQCPQIAALADSMIGFPEPKVGLFPGGGGTAEMGLRSQAGGAKSVVDTAARLTLGEVSANADQARALGYLRPTDHTVYHPERLITEARELAKTVEPRVRPDWQVPAGPIGGMIDRAQEQLRTKGDFSDHDEQIGDRIKAVLAKSTSFDDALARERQLFLELCEKALTQARIRHMLDNGKPLRN